MTIFFRIFISLSLLVFVGSREPAIIEEVDNIQSFVRGTSLEKNTLYFILRGSQTKLGGFAKQYNQFNEHATHVALGVFTDSLRIYHVNTGGSNENSLRIESMDQFITSQKDPYDYLGIWKVLDSSPSDLSEVERKILEFNSLKASFDYSFDIDSDDRLYCSEFIYKVIEPLQSSNFVLPMYTKEVPKAHRFFLKKDSLTYYPTDFFIKYKHISFVDEWKLGKTL